MCNFTDHCHRVETQMQLLNIVYYPTLYAIKNNESSRQSTWPKIESDTSWLRCRAADDYNTNFGSSFCLVRRRKIVTTHLGRGETYEQKRNPIIFVVTITTTGSTTIKPILTHPRVICSSVKQEPFQVKRTSF